MLPHRITSLLIGVTLVCAPHLHTFASASRPSVRGPQQAQTPAIVEGHTLQLRATASPTGALIEWGAAFEFPTLGFNVYRIAGGRRDRLNSSLIAGSVLISAPRTQTYAWFDPSGTPDSQYSVEAIGLNGEPLTRATAAAVWRSSLAQRPQSPLLADLGSINRIARTEQWAELAIEKDGAIAPGGEFPASLSDQWSIANQPSLKIGVRTEGWYRITQPQMVAAGFDVTGDARNLQLFAMGGEISMRVSRASGQLTSNDFIEFWGQGIDVPTADTQVYWLVNGAQPGKRMDSIAESNSGPADTPQPLARSFDQKPVSPQWPDWIPPVALNLPRAPSLKQPLERREEAPANDLVSSPPKSSTSDELRVAPKQEQTAEDLAPTNLRTGGALKSPDPPAPRIIAPASTTQPIKSLSRPAFKPSFKRKVRRARARKFRRRHHVTIAAVAAPAFVQTIQRQDRSVYFSAALNGDRENFFGPVVVGGGPVMNLTARGIETTSSAPAQLQVALQGVSLGAHQVKVFVNGSLAGTVDFADQFASTQTFSVPLAWLVEGDNAVKLSPAGSNDTSVVDYVRLTYPRSFRADNDGLQFTIKSTQTARLDGFTTANVRVLDISDPANVQELHPIIEAIGGTFSATIPGGDRGKARRLVALPQNRLSQPAWLTLNQPSTLNRSTNAADFLIITHKEFIPALAPLIAQRQAQGLTVVVADVEDVFDEFSYGTHSSQAIRELMSLALTNWARAPRYLLMIGDASYDPRNYLGAGTFDFVPSKQIDTGAINAPTALETASDDWLTDFNGDGIADISVGRLPVRTAAEANLLVSKTVNYSPANVPQSALLVADAQGSYYFNFEAADDQVAALLPPGMTKQKVYRRLESSDAAARNNIAAHFNAGQAVAVYSGHGNVDIWAGSMFSATDALGLTNGNRLSFVVVMDCLNGYFADPSLQSLAESFVKAPNGGAVASFASSGLTIPDGQHEMGLKMFELLYTGSPIAIGDASRQAKLATTDIDVRRTWILFGDPSLKIR